MVVGIGFLGCLSCILFIGMRGVGFIGEGIGGVVCVAGVLFFLVRLGCIVRGSTIGLGSGSSVPAEKRNPPFERVFWCQSKV